jgi:hypothetical protein
VRIPAAMHIEIAKDDIAGQDPAILAKDRARCDKELHEANVTPENTDVATAYFLGLKVAGVLLELTPKY